MTNKLTYIVLAVSLLGCGKKGTLDVAPEFTGYVQRFEQVSLQVGAPVQVTDLSVKFGQMQSANENGACEIVGDKTPSITINETVWNAMDDLERESLIFHELGHCVLHRNHKRDLEADGAPVSIMNPYRIDASFYESNVDYYHHELFEVKGEF